MVKTFSIDVQMPEEWVDTFLSMLKEMEDNGKAGRSRLIAFYSDGDGNFRPKFRPTCKFNQVEKKKINKEYIAKHLDYFYDAG